MRRHFLLLLSVLAGFGLVTVSGPPASAASTTSYNVCVEAFCNTAYTIGQITWYNRTANVRGYVVDQGDPGNTTARFTAYAGTRQIGPTQTRTIDNAQRNYDFSMGDTNLVGGINKIVIQVCAINASVCGTPRTFLT